MKKLLVPIPLILILLTGAACRKVVSESKSSKFFGKWLFVRSIGGASGRDTVKPEGNWVYIFQKDSIFHRTFNDTLRYSGTYQVRSQPNFMTGKDVPVLLFNYNQQPGLILNLKEDTLYLSDNHTEPYTSLYVKIK